MFFIWIPLHVFGKSFLFLFLFLFPYFGTFPFHVVSYYYILFDILIIVTLQYNILGTYHFTMQTHNLISFEQNFSVKWSF
jgi:hypothetical protein